MAMNQATSARSLTVAALYCNVFFMMKSRADNHDDEKNTTQIHSQRRNKIRNLKQQSRDREGAGQEELESRAPFR